MSFRNILLALTLCTGLSSCVIKLDEAAWNTREDDLSTSTARNSFERRAHRNSETIQNLVLGTRKTEVVSALGRADFSEAFSRAGENYQILYYRTHQVRSDSSTSKDETTPLVFKDESLLGWGENSLSAALN